MNSKELRDKFAKEFELDKLLSKKKQIDKDLKEYDKWLAKLIKKNGVTKY